MSLNDTAESWLAAHYDDMVEPFRNVEYAALREGEGQDTFTLVPAGQQPAERAP